MTTTALAPLNDIAAQLGFPLEAVGELLRVPGVQSILMVHGEKDREVAGWRKPGGRSLPCEDIPGEVFSPGSPSCERLGLPISWPGMTVTLTVRNAGDVPGKLTAVWWGVPLSHPHER